MKIKLYIRVFTSTTRKNRIIIFTLWLHQWVVKTECTICSRTNIIIIPRLVLSCIYFHKLTTVSDNIQFMAVQVTSLRIRALGIAFSLLFSGQPNHHSKATLLHCSIRIRVSFHLPLSSQDWFDMNKCFVNVVALSSSLLGRRCCSSWRETTSPKNKANWSRYEKINTRQHNNNVNKLSRLDTRASQKRVIALQGRCISRIFTLTRLKFVFKGKNRGEAKVNEMKWIWIRRRILRRNCIAKSNFCFNWKSSISTQFANNLF